MTLTQKFKKDVRTLRSAVDGEFYLDVKNPKLYRKLLQYYNKKGVIFSDDPFDNYEIVMDQIYSDLQSIEVV